ncbi:MAG: protein kinase [Thermoanaerobaculia bacterium]
MSLDSASATGVPSSTTTSAGDGVASLKESAPRYEVFEELGAGAMGVVHRARDRALDRIVALKFLRSETDELSERFVREARAQGAVDHPNICEVYDTGRLGGRAFIAMRFIDGPTLQSAGPQMMLLEQVQVVRTVSEAVHAAHRCGLVHRDIKPSNILLQQTDRGWHPYLTDFGLVADERSGTLTTVGAMIGTPDYMPPEQVTGLRSAVDRRSDVYSLGAMLYEFLTGKPPFAGGSIFDVINRVLHDEPVAPRSLNRSVPRDLELIALKCLEKEKQRRYDSARELATDLGRYLEGEPILARPSGLIPRIARRIRRHRTISALVAISLIVVAISIGGAARYVARSRRQSAFAEQFEQQRLYVRELLRHAYRRRLHDIRPEVIAARLRIQRLLREAGSAGDLAAGPGHYAAGAALLALHDDDAALRELNQSWQTYRQPVVAYARALALGGIYERELAAAQRISSREPRERRLRAIERQYRAPIAELLRASRGIEAESRGYVEALTSYYAGRYEQAHAGLAKVARDYPWLYEARVLDAHVLTAMSASVFRSGNGERSVSLLLAADSALAAAEEIAPSDPSIPDFRCATRITMMRTRWQITSSSSGPLAMEAQAACDRALRADPDLASAWEHKAQTFVRLAVEQESRADPALPATLARAVEAARQSIRLDPHRAEAWHDLGQALWWSAPREVNRHQEFVRVLEECTSALQRAAGLDPNSPSIRSDLGNVYLLLRDHTLARGGDPRPALQNAIAAYASAIRIDPQFINPRNNIALAYTHLARYEALNQRPFAPLLDRGTALVSAAQRANPQVWNLDDTLGEVEATRAELLIRQHQDPSRAIAASRAWVAKAAAIRPDQWMLYRSLNSVALTEALWRWASGEDPRPSFDEAIRTARLQQRAGRDPREVARAQIWRTIWCIDQQIDWQRDLRESELAVASLSAGAPMKGETLALAGIVDLVAARGSSDRKRLDEGTRRLSEAFQDRNVETEYRMFLPLTDAAAPLPWPAGSRRKGTAKETLASNRRPRAGERAATSP